VVSRKTRIPRALARQVRTTAPISRDLYAWRFGCSAVHELIVLVNANGILLKRYVAWVLRRCGLLVAPILSHSRNDRNPEGNSAVDRPQQGRNPPKSAHSHHILPSTAPVATRLISATFRKRVGQDMTTEPRPTATDDLERQVIHNINPFPLAGPFGRRALARRRRVRRASPTRLPGSRAQSPRLRCRFHAARCSNNYSRR
jgi:hypothetical protein